MEIVVATISRQFIHTQQKYVFCFANFVQNLEWKRVTECIGLFYIEMNGKMKKTENFKKEVY